MERLTDAGGCDADCEFDDGWDRAIEQAISIVQEVEKEYLANKNVGNNGWIPCSERLPDGLDYVIYTHKDGDVDICPVEYFRDYLDRFTAWRPLPEPYKEHEQKE